MKLAASNIAWKAADDAEAAELLLSHGFKGVEIAPTRVWPDPLAATVPDIRAHRRFWETHGLSIVALQSLLFGRSDLTIFDSRETRMKTAAYLSEIISLGAELGASVLVFGSPKNRLRGRLPPADALGIATDFFRELGVFAARHGMTFCIEPNPAHYGCDFIQTSLEGRDLVQAVHAKGFGLHLDAAGMTLSQESPPHAIAKVTGEIRHFHASEKELAPLTAGTVPHDEFSAALRTARYEGWVSMEMRCPDENPLQVLDASLARVKTFYS